MTGTIYGWYDDNIARGRMDWEVLSQDPFASTSTVSVTMLIEVLDGEQHPGFTNVGGFIEFVNDYRGFSGKSSDAFSGVLAVHTETFTVQHTQLGYFYKYLRGNVLTTGGIYTARHVELPRIDRSTLFPEETEYFTVNQSQTLQLTQHDSAFSQRIWVAVCRTPESGWSTIKSYDVTGDTQAISFTDTEQQQVYNLLGATADEGIIRLRMMTYSSATPQSGSELTPLRQMTQVIQKPMQSSAIAPNIRLDESADLFIDRQSPLFKHTISFSIGNEPIRTYYDVENTLTVQFTPAEQQKIYDFMGDNTAIASLSFEVTTYCGGVRIRHAITNETIVRKSPEASFTLSHNEQYITGQVASDVTKPSSWHSVRLRYKLGDSAFVTLKEGTAWTYYIWSTPESLKTLLPDSEAGTCLLELSTYAGGVHVGTQTRTVTLFIHEDDVPEITSATITDIEGLEALYGLPIQRHSKLRIQGHAEPSLGTAIESYSIQYLKTVYQTNDLTTGYIPFVETEILFRATDKRGRYTEMLIPVSAYPYIPPQIRFLSVYRNPSDTTKIRLFRHINFASVSQQNTLTEEIYRRLRGSEEWGTPIHTQTYTGEHQEGNLDLPETFLDDEIYEVRYRLVDSFSQALSTEILPVSYITMSMDQQGVGIGKHRSYGVLDIGGDVRIDGRMYAGGLNTTSASANVYNDPDSGAVLRINSSRRYKTDISPYENLSILQAEPVKFKDKAQKALDPDAREYLGFIAEDFDQLGLTELVEYNRDGEPEAIHYDRISAALLGVIKQQQQQIDALILAVDTLKEES